MISLTEAGRRLRDPYWWLNRVHGPFTALHRRFAQPGFEGDATPRIVFLIKLIGREDAADWDGVRSRLQATLESVDRQEGAGISVLLCGQDLPEGLRCRHELQFVKAPCGLNRIQGIDKQAKHRIGARALVDRLEGPAYVVMLDADDVVHPGFSRFLRQDNNRRGYIVTDGYMWDVNRPLVARLSRESTGMPFDEMCGSCAAIAVDLSAKRTAKRILCTMPLNHQVLGAHMQAMGQPLDHVPFPAMIYAVNHDDNMSSRFGRDSARGWLFADHGVRGPQAEAVLREFGVSAP